MNPTLQAWRSEVARWWQQRPPRERWLLLGGSIVAILVAIDLSWTAPLEKQTRRLEAERNSRQEALAKVGEPVPADQAREAARLREEEARLRQRLQAAQAARERLGRETARLPELLRTLTAQPGGSLRLVALELLPDPNTPGAGSAAAGPEASRLVAAVTAVALQAAGGASAPAPGPAASAAAAPVRTADGQPLHRLPLVLKVSGPYAELQRLLAHIETEAPSLQWTALTLDSSRWPAVQMTLRAQATSLRPDWGSPS